MTAALRAACAARIGAAVPGGLDASADAEGVQPARLPAWWLALRLVSAAPESIGRVAQEWEIEARVWRDGGAGVLAAVEADAAAIRAAILGAPQWLGIEDVRHVEATGAEAEIATGERRVGRATITFQARVLAPSTGA